MLKMIILATMFTIGIATGASGGAKNVAYASLTERGVDATPSEINDADAPEGGFTVFAACSYSETPCKTRAADLAAKFLKSLSEGSPREEIRRVALVFGLDPGLLNAIARVESDFNPHERTGSYVGLFQLSKQEFGKYGPIGGSILDARDNAIAAAAKIEDEEALFKLATRRVPSDADLYLIHQQGLQGAAQHLAKPDRPAWQSMCATDEGREKGEGWCKRAIWGNTLPAIKRIIKKVERFTSGEFVSMWAQRVASFLGVGQRDHEQSRDQQQRAKEREEPKRTASRHHQAQHHVKEARHGHHHLRRLAKS